MLFIDYFCTNMCLDYQHTIDYCFRIVVFQSFHQPWQLGKRTLPSTINFFKSPLAIKIDFSFTYWNVICFKNGCLTVFDGKPWRSFYINTEDLAIISTFKLKCPSRHIPVSHVCSLMYLPTFFMLVCLSIKKVSLNQHLYSATPANKSPWSFCRFNNKALPCYLQM